MQTMLIFRKPQPAQNSQLHSYPILQLLSFNVCKFIRSNCELLSSNLLSSQVSFSSVVQAFRKQYTNFQAHCFLSLLSLEKLLFRIPISSAIIREENIIQTQGDFDPHFHVSANFHKVFIAKPNWFWQKSIFTKHLS